VLVHPKGPPREAERSEIEHTLFIVVALSAQLKWADQRPFSCPFRMIEE
jgi:hypothetical protein